MRGRLKTKLEQKLLQIWQDKHGVAKFLRPISWFYCFIVFCRRWAYRLKIKKSTRLSVPVVVVGNLTVGGTGKTPLVVWVANYLKEQGYHPGIISRGYGGKAHHWPQQVRPDGDPVVVGDEAILISRRTNCPMAVGPDRVIAGQELLHYHPQCDIIISDDGLQHYALKRDIEVAVIDGQRRFGNAFCLPAGPLREPMSRLKKVDLLVANGTGDKNELTMQYETSLACNLQDERKSQPLNKFKNKTVHAVAGIGHPERFFTQLEQMGIKVIPHSFPDHHPFTEDDLVFEPKHPVLMTEKDAVKCKRLSASDHWFVPVAVTVQKEFSQQLINLLGELKKDG